MARSPALAGSLAIHGAVALLIVLLLTDRPPTQRTAAPPGGVPIEVVPAATRESSTPPGGSPQPQASAAQQAAQRSALPPTTLQAMPATHRPRPARMPAPRTEGTPTFAAETTLRMEGPDESGGSQVAGHGEEGRGGGRGAGIGLGDGDGITNPADVAALPLPLPPRISLARPPTLIWPTKDGPIVDSELYVARLQIDSDGLVDGVRLVRRFREPRDDQAEDAVWRFRYLPALDDDGHPTRATIEQPFMLHLR